MEKCMCISFHSNPVACSNQVPNSLIDYPNKPLTGLETHTPPSPPQSGLLFEQAGHC